MNKEGESRGFFMKMKKLLIKLETSLLIISQFDAKELKVQKMRILRYLF